MFVKKKRKKLEILVLSDSREKAAAEKFHGLIPELKLSYISQHVSGAILLLLEQHLTTQKSFHRAD